MIIAQLFDCFIIFSCIGWVYECTYCTCKEGHWQNRGFLYGPVCPIYGSGVVLALIVFSMIPTGRSAADYPMWQIFLICAIGSAVLEFGTSWVLEHFFHALWWDYSNVPFNIQGRICLPATCGFGIAGIIVVKYLFPFLEQLPTSEHPLINEIVCIVFAVFLGMDLALTVASLTSILERMDTIQVDFNDRMESSVQTIQQGPSAVAAAAKDAAVSTAETAAIAAMLAGDAAKEQVDAAKEQVSAALPSMPNIAIPGVSHVAAVPDKVRDMLGSLSARDRYHLSSIRSFRPVRRKGQDEGSTERMSRLFKYLQKNAGDRQVKHTDEQ